MAKLDSAEKHINSNNENTIDNASKDRLRAKKRKGEIDEMTKDYETNIKVDPEEMQLKVKEGVQVALLRMTEKKMMAEMKLEQALTTIKEKDARIAELESIVRQLAA